jgi:hypothetical protein
MVSPASRRRVQRSGDRDDHERPERREAGEANPRQNHHRRGSDEDVPAREPVSEEAHAKRDGRRSEEGAQFAPGPLAAQLAIYLGWVKGRVLGATAVAAAFIRRQTRGRARGRANIGLPHRRVHEIRLLTRGPVGIRRTRQPLRQAGSRVGREDSPD